MKISREINGVTYQFGLTEDELFSAYIEQKYIFDVESCNEYLEGNYHDEEWYVSLTTEKRKELIGEAVFELRRNIDKYGMDFEHAIDDAFVNAIYRCMERSEDDIKEVSEEINHK